MLKHAQRTRRLRGLPRPDFRRSRFLSQSWPARINEIKFREAVPVHYKRSSPMPAGMKRESGVSLEFEDSIPRASTSHEELAAASKRLSCLSDTSSAFSGSDNMASSQSLLDAEDLDLSDLVESSVDSDGDDLTSSFESLTFQDTLKDCLEKDPSERTEKDVEMLMEFTKQLDAFAKMTLAVQRAICSVMVFAVVESAGTDLMREGDEIDSWCVIVNGSVEVVHPGGATEKLHVGNCFGARASLEKLSHRGVMRTCCDDCQFVCVPQSDFFCILHQGEENIRRHEEGGRVVLVTEPQGDHQVVTRGTPEKLIKQLVEDKPAYIEDFLLTHRTFIDDPLQVTNQLQKWFSEPSIRDRVARVVLLWVRNHLNDFEANPEMMAFLETFVCWLEQEGLKGELGMLTTLLEASSRSRTLVLARSCRDETLQISVKGGCDQGFGIFISQVDKHSKAEQAGFLRGDQILEVNGQNFELSPVTHDQALKILRDSTHLSITVRSNIMVFRELLQTADASRRRGGRTSATGATTAAVVTTTASLPARVWRRDKEGRRARLQRVLAQLGQPLLGILTEPFIINASLIESSLGSKLFNGHTTAALPSNQSADVSRNTYTMHSLKVYKSDQTFRYLLVHAETTALEVVRAALREFGMAEEGTGFFLCEVSVAESGLTKQSRLPDHLTNLAERISLNSRYYLKAYGSTEPLVPDELVPELARDSRTHFLQLNCAQVAVQLTLDDFSVFRQIQSTEYVDHVFGRNSRYGTPMLARFAELANREMFWVITEICSEMNVVRRSKIIKQFIKLARECKACNNFNSMFAILAGLGYRSVSRLKLSWERLPVKYQRLFSDLEDLMDTSRNMSKYRQLVASKMSKGPIIPFYPLVTKDLTFICEGNETYVDGLINFEKLRKFASVVRTLNNMCSSPYDLFTFLEQGGQTSHAAMRSLNLNLTSGTCQPSEDLATIKRRKTSPAMLNPKKMFEEAQMVRRVKEYLNNMPVITDEEKLYVMSLMCEPPLRKRHPSPPPPRGGSAGGGRTSPAGSSSSTGMKRSLSARKLQSLSEPIRSRGPGARRKGSSPASPVSTPAQPAADRRGKTASDTVLEHVQTWSVAPLALFLSLKKPL